VVSTEVKGIVAGDAIGKVEFGRRERDAGGTVHTSIQMGGGGTRVWVLITATAK
jgi:hypothetical protein